MRFSFGEIMELRKSTYFDDFRCIASACPDSCCKEWDVQVDAQSAAFYRGLPGPLGDRLRQVLRDEDGETAMTIENDRCPMWRHDGLCQIQAELGHDALCKTCRDFPRLTHNYGSFVELGLELSCPEAARLILSSPAAPMVVEEVSGGEDPEYDTDAMDILLETRAEALKILESTVYPTEQVLALLLVYGYQAQALLDGEDAPAFDPEAVLQQAAGMARKADIGILAAFYANLEILTQQWSDRLHNPIPAATWSDRFRNLARYGVERYWLQAVSDFDLVGRVKLIVTSCILIHALGGELTATAQLYSKEIENDADNIEAILDGAYASPTLTDDKLLGWLLLE